MGLTTTNEPTVHSMGELPEGWRWAEIGSVCEVNPRRPRLNRSAQTLTSFLPMAGVDEAEGIIETLEARAFADVAHGFTYFEEGDVLFAKITPCMENGKCAIARDLIDSIGFGSTEFHVLRPGALVLGDWVHRYLRRESFRTEAKEHFRGAVGQQRVPDDYLKSSLIPVPPVDIQRRIMTRVDALMAEIKESYAILERMRNDADRVLDAALAEVFDVLPTKSSDWKEEQISNFCYRAQYGYTQSANFEPVGPKFLRITDIRDSKVDWQAVPYCEIPGPQISNYQLQKGDLLFARSGATTGKTFLVGECPPAVFASYLIRLRVRESVLPELLAWFFRSPAYWLQIKPRGAAQPNMNARLLEQILVRYPVSKNVQLQVVSYLDSIDSKMNEVHRLLANDLKRLTQLEQAILEQAFRGTL